MPDLLLLVLYICSSEDTKAGAAQRLFWCFVLRQISLQDTFLNTKITRSGKALKRCCREEGKNHAKPLFVYSHVVTCQVEKSDYKPAFLHFEVGRRKFFFFF